MSNIFVTIYADISSDEIADNIVNSDSGFLLNVITSILDILDDKEQENFLLSFRDESPDNKEREAALLRDIADAIDPPVED